MTDEIKDILKRYDEIGALILEQKLDEFGDRLGQVPEGSDAASFEEYIQDVAREETEKATKALETEPDDRLGGRSLRDVFDGMTLEEKEEALEYSAVTLDRGVPNSLIQSIAEDDREKVRDYRQSSTVSRAIPRRKNSLRNPLRIMSLVRLKSPFRSLRILSKTSSTQVLKDLPRTW